MAVTVTVTPVMLMLIIAYLKYESLNRSFLRMMFVTLSTE